jgi:hypothetical protein
MSFSGHSKRPYKTELRARSVTAATLTVLENADRLRCMAFRLRADAAQGILPSSYSMVGVKETEMQNVLDGTPAAISAALATPECKEVNHILKKFSISIERVETVGEFDLRIRAKAVPLSSRLQLKAALVRAGLLV